MKKIIVVGASAASIAFISKLRSFDQESEIICFSGESDLPYNRCFLADFLTGEQTQEQLQLKPHDFFAKNKVDLRLNSWVSNIDVKLKTVHLAGQLFNFDYLFLGMGCRPFIPKFLQGTKIDGIFTFHTLQDMQKIQSFIVQSNPKNAVVIGAGLNGVEAASSLSDLKISVTVVEAATTILPGQVDSQIATWVLNRMQKADVRVITGRKVVGVEHQNGKICTVILDNGLKVATSMLIIAAGSVVNSDLLEGSDVLLANGSVVVDHQLKTNFEYVFAAGDIGAAPDMFSKKLVRSSTWSDAMLQGLCAATNLSENPRSYPGVVGLRDSYFFGVDFYACGQTVGHDQSVQVIQRLSDGWLQKFYVQENLLIGFVLIGDISKLSEYKMWYMTKRFIHKADLD